MGDVRKLEGHRQAQPFQKGCLTKDTFTPEAPLDSSFLFLTDLA